MVTLCESLHLCCLNSDAPEPDGAFDHYGSDQGTNGYRWQCRRISWSSGQEFGHRLLENLQEGHNHYDGEDEDS